MNHASIGPLRFAIDSVGAENEYPPIVESILRHFQPATNLYESRSFSSIERQTTGSQNVQPQHGDLQNTREQLAKLGFLL